MKKIIALLVIISILTFTFQSCDTDTVNAPESGVNVGVLQLKITDAPFPFDLVEEANVTISQIEVRSKDENNEDVFEVIYDDPTTFNLIELRNGVTEDLPKVLLGIGSYDLVRLYISEASIKLKDNDNIFDLNIPSGEQTGIKLFINPPIEIVGGLSSDLLLDFDLSKSFVVQGNINSPNGFIFKPTVKAANMSTAGSVYGIVTNEASEALSSVEVKVELDGEEYITFTNIDGSYEMMAIPVGICSVSTEFESHVTVTILDVEVTAANKTEVNIVLSKE
jgi:Domain of unknown function (DUF4382)/Carboxypeptidase regulatory-like domain